MEEQIAAFVEQSRQLLVDFSARSLRIDPQQDGSGALPPSLKGVVTAQSQFIVKFTRLIEDLLDSLADNEIAVSPLLAPLLLECCAQLNRLSDAQQPALDAALVEHGRALTRRIERLITARNPHGCNELPCTKE